MKIHARSTYLNKWVREEKKVIDDDDDGTETGIHSHLNTRYDHYNEQYINHGHRVYCCINYVLVFALFMIILLVPYHIPYGTPPFWLVQKLKQTKLGQFSTYRIETGHSVHQNRTYHTLRPLYCTVLSSDSLKKGRLCLKKVLGQAWFELYCSSYYSCCIYSMERRIGRSSPPQSALPLHAIWRAYIVYLCRMIQFPIVIIVFLSFLWISVKI